MQREYQAWGLGSESVMNRVPLLTTQLDAAAACEGVSKGHGLVKHLAAAAAGTGDNLAAAEGLEGAPNDDIHQATAIQRRQSSDVDSLLILHNPGLWTDIKPWRRVPRSHRSAALDARVAPNPIAPGWRYTLCPSPPEHKEEQDVDQQQAQQRQAVDLRDARPHKAGAGHRVRGRVGKGSAVGEYRWGGEDLAICGEAAGSSSTL
jgi:hypothetical protein